MLNPLQAITRMTEEVSREHPDKSISVEFMPLDLASLRSVKRFTEDYNQKGLPLHLLINNAGIAAAPFVECVSAVIECRPWMLRLNWHLYSVYILAVHCLLPFLHHTIIYRKN